MPESTSTLPKSGADVVVGRQPIFDAKRSIVGFELLFRRIEPIDWRHGPSGDMMTAELLMNSLSIGVENIVGDRLAFVNVDRAVITGASPPMLPPNRCVLEIVETVTPDEEIIKGCRALARAGYSLALDDFVWFPGAEQLLELASIVKLDVLAMSDELLVETKVLCDRFGVELLAEKIETTEQLGVCLELGFDLFQGYLLSRPDIVEGRRLSPSRVAQIQLVTKIFQSDIDLAEIEAIVTTDPALVHQLIELASIGGAHGTKREVRTVREAGVIAGTARLRSWAALLMLVERGTGYDEKMSTALVRSKMCEILAAPYGTELASLAFTAGMVSSFDLLLDAPLSELLGTFSLADELVEAATCGDSPAGEIVADTIDYQFGAYHSARAESSDDPCTECSDESCADSTGDQVESGRAAPLLAGLQPSPAPQRGRRTGIDVVTMQAAWMSALDWANRIASSSNQLDQHAR